jgi:6-phosphogluconolactonase
VSDVLVVEDPAAALAERLVAAVEAGEHVALTGGSTPRAAYERAAASGARWADATLWFGDERCVAPEHPDSNYGMVRAALLDRLEGEHPAVHRMRGEEGPEAGARAYAQELRDALGEGIPRLDLVLLGMGPDGHVASLFPDHPELEESERTVVGVPSPGMAPLHPRISLTLPVLNAARSVIFLVAGAEKADAVARALNGPPSPRTPASLVAPEGPLLWILDPPAAARLPDSARG